MNTNFDKTIASSSEMYRFDRRTVVYEESLCFFLIVRGKAIFSYKGNSRRLKSGDLYMLLDPGELVIHPLEVLIVIMLRINPIYAEEALGTNMLRLPLDTSRFGREHSPILASVFQLIISQTFPTSENSLPCMS